MTFDLEYFNIGYLDTLSYKNTLVHRLDPRVKILVSFIFIFFVVSFPKYELSGLIPFFFYPAFLLSVGDIPLKAIAKKVLFVSPFAIFIGIFNPLLDMDIILTPFGIPISGAAGYVIMAKAVAFAEVLEDSFKIYTQQVIKNAKTMADQLMHFGFDVVSGGTDNHLMLIDLSNKNISGKKAENALERAGITVNKNMVPFDTKSPFVTSELESAHLL